jgi:two-component system, OmpR family, response regulator
MINQKQRILVVDDDPKITRLLRLNLEETGDYEVREENRGTHALTAAREYRPDLILLDVLMPVLDGGGVADHLGRTPELSHIPIVFLTAAVTGEDLRRLGHMIGGLRYLAKPVDIPEVIACLREILGPVVKESSPSAAPAQLVASGREVAKQAPGLAPSAKLAPLSPSRASTPGAAP